MVLLHWALGAGLWLLTVGQQHQGKLRENFWHVEAEEVSKYSTVGFGAPSL